MFLNGVLKIFLKENGTLYICTCYRLLV